MRILIAGAEGRVGRQVADQAIGHGHEIHPLTSSRDRTLLTDAIRRAEAVISTVAIDGAPGGERPQDTTANLVRAMVREGIGRLVIASVAGAGGHRGDLPLFGQIAYLLSGTGERLATADLVEGDVMVSDLEWTIVRAAALTDHDRTGHYRVVVGPFVPKGKSMPRGDLAALLLKTAESDRYLRKIVSVAR